MLYYVSLVVLLLAVIVPPSLNYSNKCVALVDAFVVVTSDNNKNIYYKKPRSSASSLSHRFGTFAFQKINIPQHLLRLHGVSNTNSNNNNDNNEPCKDNKMFHTLSNNEIARYSRHLVLEDIGIRGQQLFKDAAVLVIGAGGLGSSCLLYLAAAGVGHIGIVDADTVEESNLQRQIIHSLPSLGLSKCRSAYHAMKNINPYIQIQMYNVEFTSATAPDIVSNGFTNVTTATTSNNKSKKWDVIIDGSDNFPTKYLINDVCSMFNIPWVYSAILAFEGQISVFNYKNGPDYRDLLPIPPPPGDVPSCAEGGVLGVVPGIMGCFQATEAMKLILYGNNNNEVSKSKVDVLSGRVLIFDALKMKFSEIGIQRDPTRQPITSLIDYQGFCGGPQQQPQQSSAPNNVFVNQQEQQQQQQRTMDETESDNNNAVEFHSIEPKECFEKMIHGGWTPYVLDVRMQTEHNIVALPFTDHVVPYRTVRINNDVPESGDILIYCKGGIRGKKACQSLIEQGVEPTRLYNLNGGILKWQKDIDTSMPRY